jgi:hypothetical protein
MVFRTNAGAGGIPDLDKGMYGPGQFLSPMTYNMS